MKDLFLRNVGLNETEIKVYRAVLDIGSSTLGKIQEKIGIDRRNIYDNLNKLIEKGLISYTIEKGKKTFFATHPNKILDYLDTKKKEIENVEEEARPNLKELISLFEETKLEVRAEVYRGVESMKALLEEALNYKKIYFMGGNSTIEDTPAANWFRHWMKKRAKKKVWMYDLVDNGTALEGLGSKQKSEHKKMYYKFCELPKDLGSPMIVLIFGNRVAQMIWNKNQFFGFVLDSKDVKDSFMKFFDYFWKE